MSSTSSVPGAGAPKVKDLGYFLWTNSKFKDFQIIIGDRVLDVHKCVLVARSPVFAAMFQSGLTGAQTGQLKIQDFDYDTVEKAILFCYSKYFELGTSSVKIIWNLLTFGHKYDIQHLIRACLHQLKVSRNNYDDSENKFLITSAVILGYEQILHPILSIFGVMKEQEPVPNYCTFPAIGDALLVQDDAYKDMKIICDVDGTEFLVHKSILALKSPVFAQIFEKMAQDGDTSGQLKINYNIPDVFENAIKFFYTGSGFATLGAYANLDLLELLSFADKYRSEELVSVCLYIIDWDKKKETRVGAEMISTFIQTAANSVSKKIFHFILAIFRTPGFDKFDIEKASKESYWD